MIEYYRDTLITIRSMEKTDAQIIYDTYTSYGWHPNMETYENYYLEQGTVLCEFCFGPIIHFFNRFSEKWIK